MKADGTLPVSTADIMPRLADLKAEVDVLLRQLSEGEYLTVKVDAPDCAVRKNSGADERS